jgi:hypothetical protein
MSDNLRALSVRVESDPKFLAHLLRLYADSETMNDERLALELGCPIESLVQVRLCRAPRVSGADFHADIERVATRFGVRVERLAEAARRGQVLSNLQTTSGSAAANLLAARDRPEDGGGTT